jgi:hypothetical protein
MRTEKNYQLSGYDLVYAWQRAFLLAAEDLGIQKYLGGDPR